MDRRDMKDMNQPNSFPGDPVPLYNTEYYMPEYKTGEYGDWRISIMGLGHDYGYTTGARMIHNVPTLMRRDKNRDNKWETWMSLTLHEIESQELGVRYGFGHTVVMGLGLGWLAANAALNPRVTKVTVIEIDPLVIDLVNTSRSLDGLSEDARNKITIICEDALKWESNAKVDFLYVDIWKTMNEESVLSDVRMMQENLSASTVYYWGQELTIYNEIIDLKAGDQVSYDSIEDVVNNKFNLPLLIPKDIDYPEMINKVVENRKKRRLKI